MAKTEDMKLKVDVTEALKLIKPQEDRRDKCEKEIVRAIESIDYETNSVRRGTLKETKVGKTATKKLSIALRRLRGALKDKDLPPEIRLLIRDELPIARIEDWIETTEALENTPGRKKWVTDYRKWVAARKAFRLLAKFAQDPSKATATTKGGRFYKLAARLAGTPRENLQRQCIAVKRSLVNSPLSIQFGKMQISIDDLEDERADEQFEPDNSPRYMQVGKMQISIDDLEDWWAGEQFVPDLIEDDEPEMPPNTQE